MKYLGLSVALAFAVATPVGMAAHAQHADQAVFDRLDAEHRQLAESTRAGQYYGTASVPADLARYRDVMLEIGNTARRDPNFRRTNSVANDFSGTTVTGPNGPEPIHKDNPSPPYFRDLVMDDGLNAACQFHAEYLASIDRLTHDGPSSYQGTDMRTVERRVSHFAPGSRAVEGAGYSTESSGYPMGWMTSETHYRPWFNIAEPVDRVGLGVARAPSGNWYYCMLGEIREAAAPAPSTAPSAAQAPAPTPAAAPAPQASPAGSVFPLAGETRFERGRRYHSPSGNHYLIFQDDGNLVVYDRNDAFVWGLNEETPRYGENAVARFQADGNLATYTASDEFIWSALNQIQPAGTRLMLTDQGEVHIVAPDGTVVWNSGG